MIVFGIDPGSERTGFGCVDSDGRRHRLVRCGAVNAGSSAGFADRLGTIYRSLVPLLGEEDANVLMSEFPTTDDDELVTKQFLRAELAELRTEIAGSRAGLEAALREQTRWLTGVLVTSLVGGIGITAGITSALVAAAG